MMSWARSGSSGRMIAASCDGRMTGGLLGWPREDLAAVRSGTVPKVTPPGTVTQPLGLTLMGQKLVPAAGPAAATAPKYSLCDKKPQVRGTNVIRNFVNLLKRPRR